MLVVGGWSGGGEAERRSDDQGRKIAKTDSTIRTATFVSRNTWWERHIYLHMRNAAGLRHTNYMGGISAAAAPGGTGAAPPAHPWRHGRPREVLRAVCQVGRWGVAANALGESFR